MNQVLLDRLDALRTGPALGTGSLQVFPLLGERQGDLRYVLLEDGLESGYVEVRELERSKVSSLLVINHGGLPVLLLDGDELAGGKQNRIVNGTTLAPPGETELPVSCVEAGRWNAVSRRFSARTVGYPALRAAKAEQVRRSLRSRGVHEADQGMVWTEIRQRQHEQRVSSCTGAMADLYEQRRDELDEYERAIPYADGAVGMITAVGGRVAALECFDSPRTMRGLWSKLVRAAALDALAAPAGPQIDSRRAGSLLGAAHRAEIERFPSPGLGTDLRLRGRGIVGSALVHEGVVVHCVLFRVHRTRRAHRFG